MRLIRRMVREEKMRYQDFAVLTGDLSIYGTYAREIFEKCGIPYFVDEKHSVLMNPFVEFLRAAIEMVVQSFSYESVFRYLRCGLSSLNRAETDAMENYVLALGIRGLKAYAETWTRGYRSIKPDEVPQRNLLREKFYEEVQPFAEQMKKKDATVRERTEALYALVVQNQVQEKLEERRCQFEQQGQEAFAKEYSQIYGIVMELLDKIVEVLGDEKMTLAEYQEILEAGFAEASVGIIPPTADQVLIGDNERSRLKDIRVLFFVGVNDGLIPRHDAGGGILSEYDREELERARKFLSGYPELTAQLAAAAKAKRINEHTNPAYRWVALAIVLAGAAALVYGIISWRGGSDFGVYFALFGFAAVFFFSGAHVLPTAKNNRRAVERAWDEAQAAVANVLPEDFPLPARYAHPIVLDRMIRILREGRAQSKEEALDVLKADLRALTADVQVEQEEHDEVVVIKPLFLVSDYQ